MFDVELKQIENVSKENHLDLVVLYGSHVTALVGPRSDIDVE